MKAIALNVRASAKKNTKAPNIPAVAKIPVPDFGAKVYTPMTCRCCGVLVWAGQKPRAFCDVNNTLTAYIDTVGKAAYLKEAKRQCAAALKAWHEAKAKEPETGDAKIIRLLSEARKLVAKSNRHYRAAKTANDAAEVKASAAYDMAKKRIDGALATPASGLAGVGAKLAYATTEIADPCKAWHAGHRWEDMALSADAEMRALLRRAGAK